MARQACPSCGRRIGGAEALCPHCGMAVPLTAQGAESVPVGLATSGPADDAHVPIPSNRSVVSIALGFVPLGFVAVFIGAAFRGDLSAAGAPSPAYFIVPMVGWSAYFVASGLWAAFGWEHLRIRGEELHFERALFGRTLWIRTFELAEIKNVRLDPRLADSGGVGRFFASQWGSSGWREQSGIGDGAVLFDVRGRTVRVGEGLRQSLDVARELAQWLLRYTGSPDEDIEPEPEPPWPATFGERLVDRLMSK